MSNIVSVNLTVIAIREDGRGQRGQLEFIDSLSRQRIKTYGIEMFALGLERIYLADDIHKQTEGLGFLEIRSRIDTNDPNAEWVTILDDGGVVNVGHPGFGGAAFHLLKLFGAGSPYISLMAEAVQQHREYSMANPLLGTN